MSQHLPPAAGKVFRKAGKTSEHTAAGGGRGGQWAASSQVRPEPTLTSSGTDMV